MSKKFNERRFYDNIYEIIDSKKLKIGELERAINVSVGYFSRRKQRKNEMPLDKAYEIANYLGCSLDYLCNNDLVKERNEKEIIELEKQIDRLRMENFRRKVIRCD